MLNNSCFPSLSSFSSVALPILSQTGSCSISVLALAFLSPPSSQSNSEVLCYGPPSCPSPIRKGKKKKSSGPYVKKQIAKGKGKKSPKNPSSANMWLLPAQPSGLGGEELQNGLWRRRGSSSIRRGAGPGLPAQRIPAP